MSNHGIGKRVFGGGVTKLRFLAGALAALAFLVFPREAGAQTLSVDNITHNSAILRISSSNQTWYKGGPHVCTSVAAGNTNVTLALLTRNTSYTYTAYRSFQECNQNLNATSSVTFTTLNPTLSASSSKYNSATLSISGWNTSWWYKGTQQGAQCTSVTTGTTATVTGLTDGTSYTYKAYSADTCASELDDVTFYTSDLTAGDITGTSAKLTLSHYAGGAWWYNGLTIDDSDNTQCTSVTSGTTEVSLAGLQRGRSYNFRAYRASGCAFANVIDGVPFQTTVSTETPPAVKKFQASTGQSTGQIKFTWEKPSSEWNIAGYSIEYKKTTGEQHYVSKTSASRDSTSHIFTAPQSDTWYDVRIFYTIKPDDTKSTLKMSGLAYAGPVRSKEPTPAKVTGVKITPGVGRLDVTWKPASYATRYIAQIYKGGVLQFNKAAGSTSVSYTGTDGISSGVSYSVRVKGCAGTHSCDGPYSDFVSATVKHAPPGAVTGVSAAAGVESLAVSWEKASNADGYAVQWKSGNESYSSSRQNTVGSGSTTTSDITGLTGGTEHTVRVTPTREHADDGTSGEAKGTPKAARPGEMEGVSVTAPLPRGPSNLGKLNVSWTEMTEPTGFRVQWKSGAHWDEDKIKNTGSTKGYIITDLANDTEYTVRVQATKTHADNGKWSALYKAKTNAGPPGKATIDSVTAGVGTLSVSWGFVSDVTGYKVQWKSGTQNWDPVNRQRTVTNGTSTTLTLTSGTTYVVRVIAYNEDGDAAPSQTKTGVPKYDPPAKVTGVSVTPQVLQLQVEWTALIYPDGYKVQWKPAGEDSWSEKTVSGGSSSQTIISSLTGGTKYSVQVRATRTHADDGPWSDTKKGTTQNPLPLQVTGVSVEDASVLHGSGWNVKLTVSWDPEPNASGYKVQWKSGNQDWDETNRQKEVTNTSNTINLPDSGAGVMHTVQVRAKRTNAADGPWSSPAEGRPKKQSADPVTGLTLTPGLEHLAVSWTAPASGPAPENYRVQWKSGTQEYTKDPDEKRHAVVAATKTKTSYTYTIQGLTGGTEHAVQVRATIEYAADSTPVEARGTPLSPLVTAPGQQGGDDGTPGDGGDETPGGGGDDVICPDYVPYETAADVERERDPDTLAEFVKQARVGVGEILGEETEESVAIAIDRLVNCFGVAGDWMNGSVYLFAITDERKYLLAPSGSGLEGTFLNLVDENGCDVAAELIRAARGEELQCKDLGLLPDGDAAGFVQYLWDNPSDPGDDSEPGYEERGEAPGNSPKLSYVERITDEDILPGRIIILGSGYYPGWDPGEEPAPTDGDGGCAAVASEKNASGSAALGLFLAVSVLLAVSLRNRPAGKRARRRALRSRRRY